MELLVVLLTTIKIIAATLGTIALAWVLVLATLVTIIIIEGIIDARKENKEEKRQEKMKEKQEDE